MTLFKVVDGVEVALTPEEAANILAEREESSKVTYLQVKEERNRRLEADFLFNGKMFQRDSKSLDRITGAATLAGFAIANGAQPGDLRWANPDRDFGWISSDDTVVPMDAQTTFQFGQVAASIETSIVFAAKALREMDPIPTDYKDDKYWP